VVEHQQRIKRSFKEYAMRPQIEGLETRRLLSDVTSLTIGDTRFFADTVDGISGLYKSHLDGSDKTLLKTYNSAYFNPHWLTDVNGTLFFTGRTGSESFYGSELWKSDGTPDGTVIVRDIYGGAQGSDPHDLMLLNGHLVFQARNTSLYQAIITSDGTRDGTIQLINPSWQGLYYSRFSHLEITDNLLYAEIYNSGLQQYERWQSDGSKAGTTIAPPAARVVDHSLRIFGSNGDDQITLDASGGVTHVLINGAASDFATSSFSGIEINALGGDDSVLLTDAIQTSAVINGNGGLSTLRGGSGNDVLSGLGQLDGRSGDDTLSGEGTLLGGAGNDTINGGSYSDPHIDGETILDGGAGNDLIRATAHPATLIGGDGNDSLVGSADADSILGGAGDDSLNSGRGDDTLDGESGHDTLVGGFGVETFIFDEDDTVINDDPITLNADSKSVAINGTLGDDIVRISLKSGDPQTVVIRVNDQTVEVPVSNFGHISITTGNGNDDVAIDADVPFDIYANFINTGDGDDTIAAGSGSNIIDPGAGTDSIDGSGGSQDRLTYYSSSTGISKTDAGLQQIVADGATDTYVNIESIVGSNFDDVIVVDAASDAVRFIYGNEGDDVITLLNTPPQSPGTIYGEAGADTLTASDHDTIHSDELDTVNHQNSAAAAAQSLFSLSGDALTLDGTDGDDIIAVALRKGDASKLQVSINGEKHVYAVSSLSSIIINASDGNDTINLKRVAIASKIFGGAGNDVIYGSQAADRIMAGDGDDWINGGAGNDVIYGEDGDDRLFGGDDRDYINGGAGSNVIRGGNAVDRIIRQIGLDDVKSNAGDLLA
jgi:ELWxxDGT repeat protein